MEQRDEQRWRSVVDVSRREASHPVRMTTDGESPTGSTEQPGEVEALRSARRLGHMALVASSVASLVLWTGAVLGVLGGMLGGLRPAPDMIAGLLAGSALASLVVLALPAEPRR